ncbi:MAG: glycosyltransferase family 4 protein [Chloroflexia bacterium]
MHLVILTQYYPPEVGAPQTRLSELAQMAVAQGHRVTVLTAMPNYPSGKIHPGYGGLVKRERREGVDIIRTAIYPTQRVDFVHRLANYFSFVVSSSLFGAFLLKRADFLMVESPPLFLGLAGIWLSRLKRARMIFNVSDLWPESAVYLGVIRRDSWQFKLSSWLEALCYRKAWVVTGQARSILASIKDRFPSSRTFLLSNGVDTKRFGPKLRSNEARRTLGPPDAFIILYAGLHGIAQGLDQVLAAAREMLDKPEFRFVLIGDGPEKEKLQQDAERLGLSNVTFLDSRPQSDIPALLASADTVLVPLKTYIPGAVPSKLYEAMSSGQPVILVASGEAAQITREHGAGLIVEPGDMTGLVKALSTLRDSHGLRRALGENGRRAAEEHFDRTRIVTRFVRFLERHARR